MHENSNLETEYDNSKKDAVGNTNTKIYSGVSLHVIAEWQFEMANKEMQGTVTKLGPIETRRRTGTRTPQNCSI